MGESWVSINYRVWSNPNPGVRDNGEIRNFHICYTFMEKLSIYSILFLFYLTVAQMTLCCYSCTHAFHISVKSAHGWKISTSMVFTLEPDTRHLQTGMWTINTKRFGFDQKKSDSSLIPCHMSRKCSFSPCYFSVKVLHISVTWALLPDFHLAENH